MSADDHGFHMSPEAFRRHGKAMIDWIADYLEDRVEQFPVLSRAEPGDVRAKLPASPPERGEPFDDIMRDVEEVILPGVTHWQSPNFYAFFPANTSYPAILGELLSAGLGVQGMLWATSPACTELETLALDWMAEALDLPERFRSDGAAPTARDGSAPDRPGGGVIQDTASSATLCAMIAARERATSLQSNHAGARQPLVAYTSTQAHLSVEKAARICGVGSDNLRLVDVDASYAMRPDRLRELVERDRAAGQLPFFVSATTGTTSSGAFDPLRPIGEICREHGLWLHVDGAMFGTAALCPEFRWIHDGLDLADSYCFNPHKWMLTNFDCDCFYVADRAALVNALSILPEYLRNKATESGAVIDYRDWQIPLGRRFRALKLWFVIRHYGLEGLRAHVRHGVALAQWFREQVDAHPDFELAAPDHNNRKVSGPGVSPVSSLNLVCFRHTGGEAVNEQLLQRLNASGKLYLTHTKLDDRFTLRLAIGGARTRREHVERAWSLIQDAANS